MLKKKQNRDNLTSKISLAEHETEGPFSNPQ